MTIERSVNHDFSLNGTKSSNFVESSSLSRHRWYYYKEGFSPSLVNEAIDRYRLKENNSLLDPFNGSGTVTLTASQRGLKSTGIEVNPFTAFVSETKTLNSKISLFDRSFDMLYKVVKEANEPSFIEGYSTFTEKEGLKKWLFNLDIIRSYSSGLNSLGTNNFSKLLKLALISSVMSVSNARKDGKCMKYKPNWKTTPYTKNDFIDALVKNYVYIREDISNQPIKVKPNIICDDSRKVKSLVRGKYDLIITSPPYVNTFDYTDIYRPEMFLGQFMGSSEELYHHRFKTVRSHIQVDWNRPSLSGIESLLLRHIVSQLSMNTDLLMNKRIPTMIVAYLEDMVSIFRSLLKKTKKNGHLWMVVSNSAYANVEVPVDLILAEYATMNGWKLVEIGVLREIKKRKTKYSPDIDTLRESVIILRKG